MRAFQRSDLGGAPGRWRAVRPVPSPRDRSPDIGPKLKHVQLQRDNIQTELNLAIATRHAELSACSPGNPNASCRHQHDR